MGSTFFQIHHSSNIQSQLLHVYGYTIRSSYSLKVMLITVFIELIWAEPALLKKQSNLIGFNTGKYFYPKRACSVLTRLWRQLVLLLIFLRLH